jgi:lysophospholipase L1-like esterase
LTMLEKRVTAFQPDVVIYFGINDLAWAMREVGQAAAKGIEIPYEHVTQVAREAGLEKGMPRVLAESRLEPVAPALVVWIYERMIQTCAGIGAQPLISFLPRPEDRGAEAEQLALQLQLAERAHFTLLDTSDAYAGVGDMSSMWVSAYDRHPNAEGHRRLAEAFHAALLKRLQSDAQPGSTQDR